jgi:hypothetical protein
MMKALRWAHVVILTAVAVRMLTGCLGRLERRVIDIIGEKSVIEYRQSRHGIAGRVRYLSDSGGLHRLSLSNLSSYITEKYAAVPASRDAAIRDFIRLHNPFETLVLRSEQDIPGFTRDQLDPDLRDLTLAPVETVRNRVVSSVVYSWTRVGGKLKRYMFESHPKGGPECRSCRVLQTGVGDAAYLH